MMNINQISENEDKLIQIDILSSETIVKYLDKMKISKIIAKKECKEILFRYKGKEHNVLAFVNISGWYEVRNDYISGYIGKKDISYVRCQDDNIITTCCVFPPATRRSERRYSLRES